MLLVEAAEHNGRPLTEQEREKLAGLANFAARAALEPKTLAELTERQSEVGPHKMVWVLPFLTRYPQHQWAARLYQAHGKANRQTDDHLLNHNSERCRVGQRNHVCDRQGRLNRQGNQQGQTDLGPHGECT